MKKTAVEKVKAISEILDETPNVMAVFPIEDKRYVPESHALVLLESLKQIQKIIDG
jgi:hypothetical protein